MFSPGDLVRIETNAGMIGYVLDWNEYVPKNESAIPAVQELKRQGMIPVHCTIGEMYCTAIVRPELVKLLRKAQ